MKKVFFAVFLFLLNKIFLIQKSLIITALRIEVMMQTNHGFIIDK